MDVTNMVVTHAEAAVNLNAAKYGRLCADTIPKIIENDAEFDRMAAKLEALSCRQNPSPEENALAELLAKLIQDYDDRHHAIPDVAPHKAVQYLMEWRGLKQADLVPVIGSSSQVSDLVSGKRGISKAQARKLAEFFKVSPALFI